MGSSKNDKPFFSPFQQLKKRAAPSPSRAPCTPKFQTPQPDVPDDAPDTEQSDEAIFRRAMTGTKPLRPGPMRQRPDPTVERQPIHEDTLALAELEGLVKGHGSFRVHESEEVLFGLAPGVNLHLLTQLQQGHFAYQRHLDLHGHRQETARLLVQQFIATARRNAERCVLIVTGRGKNCPDGVSVLRQSLPRWLTRSPCRAHVLAFCTALSVDGGAGAFYVLLRKPGTPPFGAGAEGT